MFLPPGKAPVTCIQCFGKTGNRIPDQERVFVVDFVQEISAAKVNSWARNALHVFFSLLADGFCYSLGIVYIWRPDIWQSFECNGPARKRDAAFIGQFAGNRLVVHIMRHIARAGRFDEQRGSAKGLPFNGVYKEGEGAESWQDLLVHLPVAVSIGDRAFGMRQEINAGAINRGHVE